MTEPLQLPTELVDTDVYNSTRFADKYCAGVRYTPERGWLYWNETRWSLDRDGVVWELAKDTARLIFYELRTAAPGQQKSLFGWARQSQRAERLRAMIFLAQSEAGIATHWDNFDANPWLLACHNGTVDLHTGGLRPSDRQDMLSRLAPIDFTPEAACPIWQAFLERVLPNKAVREFVQRAAGYSLTGLTVEQCLFFCYGRGSNGKTIFLEILRLLLGEHAVTASFDSFSARRAGAIPNDIARLAGARLVTVSEVEDGVRLREVLVKDLTGGDTITARFLNREFFDFRPLFKLWARGNHKPQIRGTDDGIWRRIRLIEFPVQIPEGERDPHLFAKLQKELPGILAWAVMGCLAWQKDGLKPPEAVRQATQAYREEQDVIGNFLTECCSLKPHATVGARELYERYSDWCHANGHGDLSQTRFGGSLAERGFSKQRVSNGRQRGRFIYRGLSLSVNTVNSGEPNSYISPIRARVKENTEKSIHNYSRHSQDDV